MDLNGIASEAFYNALKRGKTSVFSSHNDVFIQIMDEVWEYKNASETNKSEHLPEYTEAQEELADVLICCLTELHKRGVNVEAIVEAKVEYNKRRAK